MLLAEELALIGIDPESGRYSLGTRDNLNACLAALLIAEGLIDENEPRSAVVNAAAEVLAEKKGKIKAALSHMNRGLDQRLGAGTWESVIAGLVDAGIVAADDSGMRRRNRVLDTVAREAIVERLRAAAASDEPMPVRTAVLLSTTGPAQLLQLVSPDRRGRKHARRRIDTALDDTSLESIGASVRKVLDEAAAAIGAAAAVGAVAATSS